MKQLFWTFVFMYSRYLFCHILNFFFFSISIVVPMLVTELSNQYFCRRYYINAICTTRSNKNISAYLWKVGTRSISQISDTYGFYIQEGHNGNKISCKPFYKNGQIGKEVTGQLHVACKFISYSFFKPYRE